MAAEHPGSTGGYSGQYMVYDAMGRLVQQSNPTEITSMWANAGDDASGWVYTLQAYDWKSRPTITTNADGTTRDASYGGCGCAGGEVITVRDERGRRRKMTMDVLGRLARVEELNWNQTVYATTTYSYNARDQLTAINQAGQVRSLEYDGYGRLSARVTPEQGRTTYTYYSDDTTQTMTDARGATTTFSYNARHLPTGVSYDGAEATPNVTLAYDAAGNRTQMTDGLGTATYQYDQLSRLTAETRSLTGVGSFTLGYTYNPAGELTKLTNPWGAEVISAYDRTGRLSALTGTGYGVGSFASNVQYRAFGAVKQLSYGNSRQLSVAYDNRLRATRWDVAGVIGSDYSYSYFGENTGRVTYARNLYDATLDRSYDYDHVGRLIAAYTGSQARAHTGQISWALATNDGPYAQTYAYDQLGNTTQRQGWGGWNPSYSMSYLNNRMVQNPATGTPMQYDAAGNLTDDGFRSFEYDAAGRQTFSNVYGGGTETDKLTQAYDGDGLRAMQDSGLSGITYYVRSSVLGGQVVAEVDSSGQRTRSYVYLGGQMLAIQEQSQVLFVHADPVTKSQRLTNSSGQVVSTIELDPFGGETTRSFNQHRQPYRYAQLERDVSGDEAQHRRYHGWWSRFAQPDPFDGSYDLTDPQSLNRYAYVQNDPVNFIDPSGLDSDLDDMVSSARNALQGGTCRSLFGSIDPNRLLDLYLKNNLIGIDSVYYTAMRDNSGNVIGNTIERFGSRDAGGVTGRYAAARDYDGDGVLESIITFNVNGISVSGIGDSGMLVNTIPGAGMFGLNLSQIRGASLIHELLHIAWRIPNDGPSVDPSSRTSEMNSETVRLMCFSSLTNNPNTPIQFTLPNLNLPITPRPLIPLIVYSNGMPRWMYDFLNWIRTIQPPPPPSPDPNEPV